jgi:hypothetical protein
VPGADVPGADVPGADVPGADVPGADVPGADVPGADVPGADVPGTDLPGTDVPAGPAVTNQAAGPDPAEEAAGTDPAADGAAASSGTAGPAAALGIATDLVLPAPDVDAEDPFRGPGIVGRAAPFVAVALLAEASLALPDGTYSAVAAFVSAGLFLLTGAELLLPWSRLPYWMQVLVPLTYTGSALALILAAGTDSAVGLVVLVPIIWTALFHRRWESGCVVAAVAATELTISIVAPEPASVGIRRVVLWTVLAALISVATHGLRARIRRSQRQRAELEARLRQLSVLADRERIGDSLRDRVISRIFAAGLNLESAAQLTREDAVRSRVRAAIDELDEATRLLRQAIFQLVKRRAGR